MFMRATQNTIPAKFAMTLAHSQCVVMVIFLTGIAGCDNKIKKSADVNESVRRARPTSTEKHDSSKDELVAIAPPQEPFENSIQPDSSTARSHPLIERARSSFAAELLKVRDNRSLERKLISERWKACVNKLPADPLPSAIEPKVANGEYLPSELSESRRSDGSFDESISSGSRFHDHGDEAIEAAGMAVVVCHGLGEDLPGMLSESANRLPPTVADVVIYHAASACISESGPRMGNGGKWRSLAKARNPLYRSLACQAAGQGEWGDDRDTGCLIYLDEFQHETDPEIVSHVVRILATIPTVGARNRLETMLHDATIGGNERLLETIGQALKTHKLIIGPPDGPRR